MDRLFAMYRAGSSVGAVVSLVIANVVPLAGVLFWHWDIWTILALYWVENGIVGLWNIPKILKAEGSPPGRAGTSAASPAVAAPAERAAAGLSRGAVAAFFVVHYGLFWLVHGIFVLVALPMLGAAADGGPGLIQPGILDPGVVGPAGLELGIRARMDQVALGAIGLAISHGVSYWTVFLGRGEYRTVWPQAQAQAPYGRLVVLHLTIIFGGIVALLLGASVGPLLVLVGMKLVLDLRFHLREHAGRAGGAGSIFDVR